MDLQLAVNKEMGTSVLQLQGTNFVKNLNENGGLLFYFT